MRSVFSKREEGRRRGEAARQAMLQQFSQDVLAFKALERVSRLLLRSNDGVVGLDILDKRRRGDDDARTAPSARHANTPRDEL
eukprot:scaffold13711_cov28-Tisochrysis_lutea.AAC.2